MQSTSGDKTFIRNFLLFTAILVVCSTLLIFGLVRGNEQLEKTDQRIAQTHEIITEAQKLSMLIEGMLGAQRGFLLTGNTDFLEEYNEKKAAVSEHIAELSDLMDDDPSQKSRLEEIRTYFNDFSTKLEERSALFDPENIDPMDPKLDDIGIIDGLKGNIVRINSSILEEEYDVLNERVTTVESKKEQYFLSLLVGVAVGSIMLLVFNGFLLNAQRKRNRIEASLKDTEQRFALAVDGAQDGIFDWDIKNGNVFYSRRFFAMLGYETKGSKINGTTEDWKALIHPDDMEEAWNQVEHYLSGELSEYDQDFRMKHQSGRWVWIHSRAKALFDQDGQPYRMVGSHTDITHMKKAQERLKAEKDEAEEANRAKSDFLAHMSHEIRTPLTAISGIAEILSKNKDNLDTKQSRLVDTLTSSTSSLKDLINDILDFSKIENREIDLEDTQFELAQLFQEVISMMSLRASEQGINFVFDYNDVKHLDFTGDQARVRQIIVNLIGNALKFTEEGSVKVKAFTEERNGSNFLRIDVADTGIGIAPEHFDLVFERFKQGDSSVSRKYGGTGLGLPISLNLAQLMGGNIFLSSEVGKGSTFSLLLPIKIDQKADNAPEDLTTDKKLNDRLAAALNNHHKALIVEDYEGNVVVIGYILEEAGIDYDVAYTGKQALDLWRDNHYDVILMDVQMPEMDGFAATKEIRREEEEKSYPRTPIIGMTAHALVGDKDKCIAAGMDAYLPKPIVEADLKRKLLRYIPKHKKAA